MRHVDYIKTHFKITKVGHIKTPIAIFIVTYALQPQALGSASLYKSPTTINEKKALARKFHTVIKTIPPICKMPMSKRLEAQSSYKHEPTFEPSYALTDTTPPTPPESLEVFRESTHSVFARWKPASDPESSIDYYAFAFGSAPGLGDITWWQSTGLNLTSYSKSMTELGLSEGDTVYVSVKAYNSEGLGSSIVISPAIILNYDLLGADSNTVSIGYDGGWTQSELSDLQWFLGRMLPIIKEIYGPPSHSYQVILVKDSSFTSSAVFYPSNNEIHMNAMYPQLLTHELIHAFRDNVILSSDANWHYDPTLSGFEESFAQGISYTCMNRYVELYPADPIVSANSIWGSSNDWDYDFQNTNILTTTDFWSDSGGTGIFWLRYEMGAAAIIKILKENPNFARDFNNLYYARLNSDHALRTSRSLSRNITAQVTPTIEGRPAGEWIDTQRIFDCRIMPGRKIWLETQHFPGWLEYLIFQYVYYYETFANGSEWVHWDDNCPCWVYHSLNGSAGHAVLRDWNGTTIAEKSLLIEPVDNPPVYYGFGWDVLNLSTDDDTAPWPNGDPSNFMLGLHDFGLYHLQVSFGNDSTEAFRIMGDTLQSATGVFGAVLNSAGGVIHLDHELFSTEPPLDVVNGTFYGSRLWASIPNSKTGFSDSKPGRISVTYIDSIGNTYTCKRNIDLGSWEGNQLFLFDTHKMTLDSTSSSVSLIYFQAERQGRAAVISWEFSHSENHRGFNVFREHPRGIKDKLNTDLLTASTRYEFIDSEAPAGETLYWLQEIEMDGSSKWYGPAVLERNSGAVNAPSLNASPNPFSRGTIVEYTIPSAGLVELTVHDAQGRRIRILEGRAQTRGKHFIEWDGKNSRGNPVSSGVYFMKLRFGKKAISRKIVIIR